MTHHPLDLAYDRWHTSAVIPAPKDDLMEAVLIYARTVLPDEDSAMDVVAFLLHRDTLDANDRLDLFVRSHAEAFSHWVMAICRRRRYDAIKEAIRERTQTSIDDDDEDGETTVQPPLPPEKPTRVYSSLPDDMREIAVALSSGKTLGEVAESRRITVSGLRKKVARFCPLFSR